MRCEDYHLSRLRKIYSFLDFLPFLCFLSFFFPLSFDGLYVEFNPGVFGATMGQRSNFQGR